MQSGKGRVWFLWANPTRVFRYLVLDIGKRPLLTALPNSSVSFNERAEFSDVFDVSDQLLTSDLERDRQFRRPVFGERFRNPKLICEDGDWVFAKVLL